MAAREPVRRRYAERLPREQRQAQLLDTTVALVAREGWPALRIARVAEAAEIAKSVIYATFGSLEGLQYATLVREQERVFATSAAAVTAARDAPDAAAGALAALSVFLEAVERDSDSWRLVLLPPAGTPPRVQAAILAGRERWRTELERLVADVGELAGLDPELVSHLARGGAEYLARLLLEDPGRFPRERLIGFVTEAFGRIGAVAG